jgi:enoyl-CoA hydratase/carnithine racemase
MSVSIERHHAIGYATIRRPPDNYLDALLIRQIADAYDELHADPGCRVIVLRSEGKHFCAGNNYCSGAEGPDDLFEQAARLFETAKPVIALVQGAAIGGGLGLALTADFRIAAPESRWSTAFARLGNHPGFGLTTLLPRVVGHQNALRLFYTAERIRGEEAYRLGLCDELAPLEGLAEAGERLAARVAESAPLAVVAIKETLRGDLGQAFLAAVERERPMQKRLEKTDDFKEGVAAMAERRTPSFHGR